MVRATIEFLRQQIADFKDDRGWWAAVGIKSDKLDAEMDERDRLIDRKEKLLKKYEDFDADK